MASRTGPPRCARPGALVHYLRDTQKADLAHVREVAFRAGADCLLVDATTLRNLEVIDAADGGRTGSLLHEIDRTMTSMGGRLLRSWLLRPLVALERIQDRLDAVEELAFRSTERAKLRETLKTIHDIERLVARASLGIAGPRDLVALRQSIAAVPARADASDASCRRRSSGASSPSSTTAPICETSSIVRSSTSRRPSRAMAA